MSAKEYRAGNVVVSFDPDVCIHSEECVRGLPRVFDTRARPWIQPQNASPEEVEEAVRRCPSGALRFRRAEAAPATEAPPASSVVQVTPLRNGPLVLEGRVRVLDAAGNLVREMERCSLCRCGHSTSKPWCDGSHARAGFRAD